MKWTAEADAHLLLKIIEVQEVKPDYARVAEAWEYGSDKPTPKAISERLVRLKRQARERLNNPEASNTDKPLPVTPKKSRGIQTAVTPKTPKTPAIQKRKRSNLTSSMTAELPGSNGGGLAELDGGQDDGFVSIKEEFASPKKVKLTNDIAAQQDGSMPSFLDYDSSKETLPVLENESTQSEFNDMW